MIEFQVVETSFLFTLIGFRAVDDVTKAETEIKNLMQVYTNFNQTESLLLMGNFRAACSYINPTTFANLEVRTSKQLYWYIDDVTSTYLKGACAFDRLVGNFGFEKLKTSTGVILKFYSFFHLGF
jgi:hypothetical protein